MSNKRNENANAVEVKAPLSDFVITREVFREATEEGQPALYGYVLKDKLIVAGKQREIRIDFAAKDPGGYEMLDIIFMLADHAYLVMHDETMTDNAGNKSEYRVYEIVNEDEYGIRYAYKVRPSRESDKAMLGVLIQQKNVKIENIVVDGGVSDEVAASN